MKKKWFQTWNRQEYKEWATEIAEGYLLLIVREEKDRYLCVQAKLLMGEKGLPGFEVLKELYFVDKKESDKQIQAWKIKHKIT